MPVYAPPLRSDLWRDTTPEVAGRGCALAPFAKHANTPERQPFACVREYADPRVTFRLRHAAGCLNDYGGVEQQAEASIEKIMASACTAALENPFTRLSAVFNQHLDDPVQRLKSARRFPGFTGTSLPSFVRWIFSQDPLACDELVRPQWAMLPAHCTLTRLEGEPVQTTSGSLMIDEMIRTMYAADVLLWEEAATS